MIHTHIMFGTPVGTLTLQADARGLCRIDFGQRAPAVTADPEQPVLRLAAEQLEAYFRGELSHFDLPLAPVGTAFQSEVWNALQAIPYGEVRSYADIANAVGRPRAFRAVGMANNRNPLPIIIPCHRVVGSNGLLIGYGGGLDIKIRLLQLERIALEQAAEPERCRVVQNPNPGNEPG